MFDFLTNPGPMAGCIVGVLAALALHWLFPERDLAIAQALLVALGCVVGMLCEKDPFSTKKPKDR